MFWIYCEVFFSRRTTYRELDMTSPGSKNKWRITYPSGKQKWTSNKPGDGINTDRGNELRTMSRRSDVRFVVKLVEDVVNKYLRGEVGESALEKVAADARIHTSLNVALQTLRQMSKFVYNQIKDTDDEKEIAFLETASEALKVILSYLNKYADPFNKRDRKAMSKKVFSALPSRLRMKTVMDQGLSSRRRQEREKKAYLSKVGPWLGRLVGPNSKAQLIAEQVKSDVPGRNTGAVLSKRRRLWVASAKKDSEITSFTEYLGGPSRMYGPALYIVRDVSLGVSSLREGKVAAINMASHWFVEKSVEETRDVFEDSDYAEEFKEFLPPKVSFELGPSREVVKLVETFGRARKNWDIFARKLAFIAERFNDMVRSVKNDLRSNDEVIRLCALMTAISIETGLRPGQVGNKAKVRDPKTGEEIEIETFGITTLQPQHVKFIRDNFAELKFVGKKGGLQVAEISDADILKSLKIAVETTSLSGETSMIFTTKDGKHVDYSELKKYVSLKWGDITPTDFRKLRATREFYNSIMKETELLRSQILNAIKKGRGDLRKEVVSKIVDVLQKAASAAQRVLSHEDWKTCIQQGYVDPRVVLNFLNQGGLNDTLDDILIRNKNVKLTFDFDAFIEQAKKSSVRRASAVITFRDKGSIGLSVEDVFNEMDDIRVLLSSSRFHRISMRVANWYRDRNGKE